MNWIGIPGFHFLGSFVMKILHIVPESAIQPQFQYSGSTKDILGRLEYFNSRALDFDQLAVKRSDEFLLEKLKSVNIKQYSSFIIEFPLYPKSIEFIRAMNPEARIFTRSINAELYHKVHLFLLNVKREMRIGTGFIKAMQKHWPILKKLRLKFKLDYKSGNRSDVLLSITEWETKFYWRYLVGKKVRTIPYYLPEKYAQEIRSVQANKENVCVSLMGVKVNQGSFLEDSFNHFAYLVNALKSDMKDWSFKVTGKLPDTIQLPARIEPTGLLDSPYPIIASSRAIAILSPFGMGFKTKILESILAGSYVLLPSALIRRLPEVLKPFCIPVALHSVASFKQALAQCVTPFPEYDPNLILKEAAFCALDELLL